jgi:hypothetical protein
MIYDFRCPQCREKFHLDFAMNDSEGRMKAQCPMCKVKLCRIWNTPAIVMKNHAPISIGKKHSFMHNGEKVDFGFVNQGNRHGLSKDSIGNTVSGARVDEKTGRMVVDVVSGIRDPLGTLERSKTELIKKDVNQKTRRRKNG